MKTAMLWLCASLMGVGALVQAAPPDGHHEMMQQMHHGGSGGPGPRGHWMADVSEAQQSKLDGIKATYLKQQAPLKARMKALQAELMALALADKPDQAATDKKIDEIAELKRQMLRNKVEKISARRAVLNEQQRAQYDIYVMKKASGSKRHGCPHMGGHSGMMGPGMMGPGMQR